jgi:hypothetical protein
LLVASETRTAVSALAGTVGGSPPLVVSVGVGEALPEPLGGAALVAGGPMVGVVLAVRLAEVLGPTGGATVDGVALGAATPGEALATESEVSPSPV